MSEEAIDVLADINWWAQQRCPCTNEQPNPCPLCGADANKAGDVCKAVDETFPPRLVERMRRALNTAGRRAA